MESFLPALLGFLVGTAVGASGMYYGQKFTDQRRASEFSSGRRQQLAELEKAAPDLLDAMRTDAKDPENRALRSVLILPSGSIHLNLPEERVLVYMEDEIPDLREKVRLLEAEGFLSDRTTGSLPRYRMTEELFRLLRDG